MKKISLVLFMIAGCLVFLFSCKKEFLEKTPPGSVSAELLATERGVESLLIGAYESLYGGGVPSWGAGIFGASMTDWEWGEITSDNAYFGAQTSYIAIERYEMLPSNSYTSEKWSDAYDGVSRANDVLNLLQQAKDKIPAPRVTEIEAEAKFLRAWHHFRLQRIYWQIPYLKTTEEMGGKDPETIPNDSPHWEDTEADLQFAVDNLPDDHPKGEVGRPTKYAAMAVLARVYLFQNKLSEAKPLLDNIINSGKFALVDKYYDNYNLHTENNVESIFEIQCDVSPGSQGNNTIEIEGCCFFQRGPASKGWGAYQPSEDLFEAFQVDPEGLPILDVEKRVPLENDMGVVSATMFVPTSHLLDPRVDWTIARRGIPFLNWGVNAGNDWIRGQSAGGPYMTVKFMHKKEDDATETALGGFKNSMNFRAYRYAHVLLWRAEVAVEEGDLEYARQLVNMVRERASHDVVMGRCTTYQFDGRPIVVDWNQPAANYLVGIYPQGHAAFASKEEARKAVRHELRMEFATEGQRFFDLRRWGIDNEVLNTFIANDSKFRYFMRGAVYNPNKKYFPLPQDQIDLQQGVLVQDPAYQ
jgi:hypothetical protein